MSATEFLQSGRLSEALADLQQQVRREPGDARLRIFLFQLLAVMGDLDVLQGRVARFADDQFRIVNVSPLQAGQHQAGAGLVDVLREGQILHVGLASTAAAAGMKRPLS